MESQLEPAAVATVMAKADRFNLKTRSVTVAGALRSALQSGQPGGWASNHRAEAERYVGWNYVAIRAIALQALSADVNAYELRRGTSTRTKSAYNEQADKGEPMAPDRLPMKLLRRPNPRQSGGMFNYERVVQLNSTGSCLIWNVPNRAGQIIERYVIPTAVAEPHEPDRNYPNGSWRITPEAAHYGLDDGGFLMGGLQLVINNEIDAAQVQTIRWPHPIVRDDGQSPLAAGALWSDTSHMVDRARWQQMVRGPNPGLIINAPDDFSGDEAELQRAETNFNKKYGGFEANRKAVFVAAGEVIPWGNTAKEMDYGTAFLQMRDAMLAIHGVPSIAAGLTDGGSYAAFYAALLQFVTLTCQPQFCVLAEEDTALFVEQFGPGITVEMLAKKIDDPAVLENQLRTDLAGHVRTRNELRMLRGLDAVDGPMGSEFVGGSSQTSGTTADESTTGMGRVPTMGGNGATKSLGGNPANNTERLSALTGDQIEAARAVLLDVPARLTPVAATELLVGAGIARAQAQRMVDAQVTSLIPDGHGETSMPKRIADAMASPNGSHK